AWDAPPASTPSAAPSLAPGAAGGDARKRLTRPQALVAALSKPPTVQPRNALTVPRSAAATLQAGGEFHSKALLAHLPMLESTLVAGLRTVDAVGVAPSPIKVHALRTRSALFGSAAPNQIFIGLQSAESAIPRYDPLSLELAWSDLLGVSPSVAVSHVAIDTFSGLSRIPLDAAHEQIKASRPDDGSGSGAVDSFVLVDFPASNVARSRIYRVDDVDTVSLGIGGAISARATTLDVGPKWVLDFLNEASDELGFLRRTAVYTQSEELALAADPLRADVTGDTAATDEIELDQYYDGLVPGMWVIAGGERADIELPNGTQDTQTKVPAAERAMIASVRHGLTSLVAMDASGAPLPDQPVLNLPGDTLHTFIRLAAPLAYRYKRDTFAIHGNVVRATHGQTTKETLGSGDATQAFQRFALKAPPLTHVSAPTPDGIASTLQVRVNKLLWHETDDLAGADANARTYRTRRDDSEATRVDFGDGKHGARLPTGQDNVTAVYRSGIGAGGNVRAGQLSVLADKPLGASAVTNPIRASGGADPDTLAQARVNAPLSVTALDRLVSVRDYADFASTFAGVGKAAATRLPGPSGDFVEITIAGIDDAPIDETSDLYRNLVEALHRFGDPHVPIRVDLRKALAMVIEARIAPQPDYDWSDVQPRVVAALNDRFGFQARGLGQRVFASELIGVIEGVRGVAHVVGGSVHLLDDDDLIDRLVPAPAGSSPAASAPGLSPSPDDEGTQANASVRRLPLVPEPGATDEGAGGRGWLAVPPATARVGTDGTLEVSPARIAYLPAGVPEALILELAS
ncbi:MAG: putative baseplate assembly protein, partial [Burkholderiaceae bacterium]